jgi:hypothetical protein
MSKVKTPTSHARIADKFGGLKDIQTWAFLWFIWVRPVPLVIIVLSLMIERQAFSPESPFSVSCSFQDFLALRNCQTTPMCYNWALETKGTVR